MKQKMDASQFYDFRVVASVKTQPITSRHETLLESLPVTSDKVLELVDWTLQQKLKDPSFSSRNTKEIFAKVAQLNAQTYEHVPQTCEKADCAGFFRVQKFDGFLKSNREEELLQLRVPQQKPKKKKQTQAAVLEGGDSQSVGAESSLTKILQQMGSFDAGTQVWTLHVNRFRDLGHALKQKVPDVVLEAGSAGGVAQEPDVQIVD